MSVRVSSFLNSPLGPQAGLKPWASGCFRPPRLLLCLRSSALISSQLGLQVILLAPCAIRWYATTSSSVTGVNFGRLRSSYFYVARGLLAHTAAPLDMSLPYIEA